MCIVRLLSFLLLVPGPVSASIPATETTDRTYCEDEGTRRDWEERTANTPGDSDLQMLHTVWLGLCVKIQREGLAVDQATDMLSVCASNSLSNGRTRAQRNQSQGNDGSYD